MNYYERNTPMSTTWTEVTDPLTLRAGDRIKVTHKDDVFEVTLDACILELDYEDEYGVPVAGQPNTALYVPAEGTKFFIKEREFAPLDRALEPGEVVEDSMGRKYATNPLNPALIITDTMGLTGPEEFVYMSVRPVR